MSASDHFILLSAITLAYAVFGMTGFGAAMVAVLDKPGANDAIGTLFIEQARPDAHTPLRARNGK